MSREKATRSMKRKKMNVAVSMCIAIESEKTSFKISTIEHTIYNTEKSVIKSYTEPIIVKQVSAHVLITAHHWMLYLFHVTLHLLTI